MSRIRYIGRDKDGEPVWVPIDEAPPTAMRVSRRLPRRDLKQKDVEGMTPKQQVMRGYQQLEERGGRSVYSAKEIKRIWANDE